MACTFKPLWKPIGELKIWDIRDNILLFEFEDILDLERVLEYEPWSYDRKLVVFQRTIDAELALLLDYSFTTFWMQIHNIPPNLVTQETEESIGNRLGTCEVWLRSMDHLKREDQQYGDWLRADAIRATRKTVTVISGTGRSQASWAKQKQWQAHGLGTRGWMASQTNSTNGSGFMQLREYGGEKEAVVSKLVAPIIEEAACGSTSDSESMATSNCRVLLEEQLVRLEKNIVNLSIEKDTNHQDPGEKLTATDTHVLCDVQPSSLGDNSVMSKPTPQFTRGWKRLAREVGNSMQGPKVGCGTSLEGLKNDFGKRGMDMEIDVLIEEKKQCVESGSQEEDKNSKVVAGSQHHHAQ